jgi:hypothetical protein
MGYGDAEQLREVSKKISEVRRMIVGLKKAMRSDAL